MTNYEKIIIIMYHVLLQYLYWKNQVASKSMIITGFEEKGSQVPYIRYHIEEKRLYKREGK